VLLRSHEPIPRAHEALSYLQSQQIPFILLTNGGGKHESERVEELSKKLDVKLDVGMFVQSHTPFAELVDHYLNKTVLVVGGDEDRCRLVAERSNNLATVVEAVELTGSRYGFASVVTPGDILVACPHIWPFSHPFLSYYKSFARPLPKPINPSNPSNALQIDAIFVYNDPRDWGLDATVILDLLLSRQGILGTTSPKNGDRSLPNNGYLQDGQPPLLFSNPDLWWAAKYHLPRLGQGGFREALEGLWAAVTGGPREGVPLKKEVIGKPFRQTYEFAEKLLRTHRHELFNGKVNDLKTVYMIGDNPGKPSTRLPSFLCLAYKSSTVC
jgi:HAD superfamily hydrolase (TIGR01456 family)